MRRKAAIRATSNTTSRSTCSIAPPAGWAPVRQLVVHHHFPFSSFNSGLAMRNGIAALALNPLYVFERRDGDWVSAPVTGVDPQCPATASPSTARASCSAAAAASGMGTLYEKNSATESGVRRRSCSATIAAVTIEFTGGPVDISGGRAVVLSPYNEEEPPRRIARVSPCFATGVRRSASCGSPTFAAPSRAARIRGRDTRR